MTKFEEAIKEASETVIIEFCYKWQDGRIEVRYRRIKGTSECDEMIKEVENLQKKPDCPYFIREQE